MSDEWRARPWQSFKTKQQSSSKEDRIHVSQWSVHQIILSFLWFSFLDLISCLAPQKSFHILVWANNQQSIAKNWQPPFVSLLIGCLSHTGTHYLFKGKPRICYWKRNGNESMDISCNLISNSYRLYLYSIVKSI